MGKEIMIVLQTGISIDRNLGQCSQSWPLMESPGRWCLGLASMSNELRKKYCSVTNHLQIGLRCTGE